MIPTGFESEQVAGIDHDAGHGDKRAQKAVVLRFLERVSSYSRQQLAQLVKRGVGLTALRKRYRGSRTSFTTLSV